MDTTWDHGRFDRSLLDTVVELNRHDDPQWVEAVSYTLKNGGKRFRPRLVFACCQDLGVDESQAATMAMAMGVEIMHTASLIHDDLPAIDNDTIRRGQPAAHVVFGEAVATISADYLFFLASEILLRCGSIDLVRLFCQCARDTCHGEALDIRITQGKRDHTLDDLLMMYEMKTARLIQFSMTAPFVVLGVKEDFDQVWEAGRRIGLAFQILDDIKDIEGTVEELGKTPGKDLLQKKPTIVAFEGIEKARERAFLNWDCAKALLEKRPSGFGMSNLIGVLSEFWEVLQKR